MEENERTMADVVLLTHVSSNNYCYIDTSNLDGEKTLKPKVPVLDKDLSVEYFQNSLDCYIQELSLDYRENVDELHTFEGNMLVDIKSSNNT